MTCCIEKSSIFAAAFGKCIYKLSNIQYYFNQKNMNYSCRKTIVPIIIGTLLSGACSNDEPTGGKGHQQTYSVVLKGITVAGEESSEELKDVSVFQFSDGNLYKEEQLTPGQGGQSEISAVSGSRLYFLTGLEIPAGEKAKSEEEFRNTIIGEGLHDNSAPDFMAETAISILPCPVRKTIGRKIFLRFISCCSSKPVISGIRMSRIRHPGTLPASSIKTSLALA